jgi:hypothetical protein
MQAAKVSRNAASLLKVIKGCHRQLKVSAGKQQSKDTQSTLKQLTKLIVQASDAAGGSCNTCFTLTYISLSRAQAGQLFDTYCS